VSQRPTSPLYFFRVSSLSHEEICAKRSKIEVFTRFNNQYVSGTIAYGNRFHSDFSFPLKSFDRAKLRYSLGMADFFGREKRKVFTKQVDEVQVRGTPDDFRIYNYQDKRYASLIEIKTTSKPYLWSLEIKAAIRQLQLYMFLLKDELERVGYPLWKRGYLEIYSQQNGKLMRRIPVEYDEHIEDWIKEVIEKFKGLRKVSPPPFIYCKSCPKQVKDKCSWYIIRSKKELC
jgi:CRISPR/Cas system-associated exonuclease Cas4 (RecB family)